MWLPIIKNNDLKAADVFEQWFQYILGCQGDADAKQLIDNFTITPNQEPYVQKRKHRHGHILDLVIFRDAYDLVMGCYRNISYRKHKSIDKDGFLTDLSVSSQE